jgi:hypothetical protein
MSNTEGSRVVPFIYQVRKRKVVNVSETQRQVIIGSILGDAYVYPQGKICIEQGQKQYDYLCWKKQILNNLTYPKLSRVIRFDSRVEKTTVSYRFFLKQYFRPLRKLFYPQGYKIIPNNIHFEIEPMALAIWYMDDGYLERRYPMFMTESYSSKDCDYLREMLLNRFDLVTLLDKKRRIRIRSDSALTFIKLI